MNHWRFTPQPGVQSKHRVFQIRTQVLSHSKEGNCMSVSSQPMSPLQEDLTGEEAATTTTQHTELERMELEMKIMEAKLREKFKSEEATLVENLKRRLEEVEARANNNKRKQPDEGSMPAEVPLKAMMAEALAEGLTDLKAQMVSGATTCQSYTAKRDVDSLKAIHALCKPVQGSPLSLCALFSLCILCLRLCLCRSGGSRYLS